MIRVDQFAFGYDEGHRLLIASREVPRALLVRLLVATDAVMSPGSPPLITGLALPDMGLYALCVTWSDPRASRAGAVCSHVLLIDAAALSDPHATEALVRLPRNPASEGLDGFAIPLSLTDGRDSRPVPHADAARSVEVLERCLQAACRADGVGVVIHHDLAESASAIVTVWSAMWPALRAHFSFRTRELAAAEKSEFLITAAPRVSGGSGLVEQAERPAPPWLTQLASAIASPARSPLRTFIETFGPREAPESIRMRRLAELWTAVEFENVEGVIECIETHWPDPEDGTALKRALFGEHSQAWWSVGERERVVALLSTRHPTWDLGELDLTGRVRALARGAHAV